MDVTSSFAHIIQDPLAEDPFSQLVYPNFRGDVTSDVPKQGYKPNELEWSTWRVLRRGAEAFDLSDASCCLQVAITDGAIAHHAVVGHFLPKDIRLPNGPFIQLVDVASDVFERKSEARVFLAGLHADPRDRVLSYERELARAAVKEYIASFGFEINPAQVLWPKGKLEESRMVLDLEHHTAQLTLLRRELKNGDRIKNPRKTWVAVGSDEMSLL